MSMHIAGNAMTRADYYARQEAHVVTPHRSLSSSEYLEALPPGRMVPTGRPDVAAPAPLAPRVLVERVYPLGEIEHGTVAGALAHRRRHDAICDPCRQAWNCRMAEMRRDARREVAL